MKNMSSIKRKNFRQSLIYHRRQLDVSFLTFLTALSNLALIVYISYKIKQFYIREKC